MKKKKTYQEVYKNILKELEGLSHSTSVRILDDLKSYLYDISYINLDNLVEKSE